MIEQLDRVKNAESLARAERHTAPPAPDFYHRNGKRALDFFSSVAGLMLLSPLLLFVACCVKLTSRGTILYRQIRMGKNGREFRILKFRSMLEAGGPERLPISVAGDARVTPFGKFIRRHKIDELPQLWNVARGEMSLVGPRPELPAYLSEYSTEQRRVLTAWPGITDPASLAYRHEEDILSGHEDAEYFYRTRILPDKLAKNLAYLDSMTLAEDLHIIFKSIASAFLPSRNK